MKKILITGANSYIGTSFETWVNEWPNEYKVDTLDVKDVDWINYSFKGYDVVFHVAGIAHVSTDPKMEELYYGRRLQQNLQSRKIYLLKIIYF